MEWIEEDGTKKKQKAIAIMYHISTDAVTKRDLVDAEYNKDPKNNDAKRVLITDHFDEDYPDNNNGIPKELSKKYALLHLCGQNLKGETRSPKRDIAQQDRIVLLMELVDDESPGRAQSPAKLN